MTCAPPFLFGRAALRATGTSRRRRLTRPPLLRATMTMTCAVAAAAIAVAASAPASPLPPGFVVLDPNDYAALLHLDDNVSQVDWAVASVPFFDIDNADLRAAYYFRWMSYRQHVFEYPDVGHVVTEFLPNVPWAGKYNTIPCAAGHHVTEGRWLRDRRVVDDYLRFWFRGGGSPRTYTFWAATAAWKKFEVDGNASFVIDLLPDLINNLYAWESSHSVPFGAPSGGGGGEGTRRRVGDGACFFQTDGADGGEVSIGGSGCRPTINSAMASEARAVAAIADLLPPSAVVPGVAPTANGTTPNGTLLSRDTFCCNTPCAAGHSTFVFEGQDPDCARRCLGYPPDVGRFYTQFTSGWCQVSTYCNTTNPIADPKGDITYARPPGPSPARNATAAEISAEFRGWHARLTAFVEQHLWSDSIQSFATLSKPLASPSAASSPAAGAAAAAATSSSAAAVGSRPRRRGGRSAEDDDGQLQCPPAWPHNETVGVRELLGFTPFFFGVINGSDNATRPFDAAFKELTDPLGYQGAWGLRTAERRAPCYNYSGQIGSHECNWNGPSWPYETCRVIEAVSNVLHDYPADRLAGMEPFLNTTTFFMLLQQYARQHTTTTAINGTSPWIGEDVHPDEGYWIARFMMYMVHRGDRNRGKHVHLHKATYYNHSTLVDLILAHLLGIRLLPESGTLVVDPLATAGTTRWFAADHVLVGDGHNVTVVWDPDGTRYPALHALGAANGFSVVVDGALAFNGAALQRVEVPLAKPTATEKRG